MVAKLYNWPCRQVHNPLSQSFLCRGSMMRRWRADSMIISSFSYLYWNAEVDEALHCAGNMQVLTGAYPSKLEVAEQVTSWVYDHFLLFHRQSPRAGECAYQLPVLWSRPKFQTSCPIPLISPGELLTLHIDTWWVVMQQFSWAGKGPDVKTPACLGCYYHTTFITKRQANLRQVYCLLLGQCLYVVRQKYGVSSIRLTKVGLEKVRTVRVLPHRPTRDFLTCTAGSGMQCTVRSTK